MDLDSNDGEELDLCLSPNDCHLQESGDRKPETWERKKILEPKTRAKPWRFVRENLLMILTLVGIAFGLAVGFLVREFKPSDDVIMWIGLPGDLYLRLLKMCIVPLTFCTVITGASALDPKCNGKLGVVTLTLVIVTHIMAVSLSLVLFAAIRPGTRSTTVTQKQLGIPVKSHEIFADLLRNLFPDNIVAATFRQTFTKYELDKETSGHDSNETLSSANTSLASSLTNAAANYKRVISYSDGVNVLGLITISCVVGVASGRLGSKVAVFLTFVSQVLEVVFLVIQWFMWLTPFGVVCLIAQAIIKVDDVTETFSDLGLFVVTVTSGILIHWLVSLPVLYLAIVRKSPLKLLLGLSRPASIGFATTNSSIALPDMMWVCEHRLGADKRVSHVVLPLLMTMNADGSSIFIASASLFITSYTGLELSADRYLIVGMLTIFSCLAIPKVPSASIVTIIIILSATNVPIHDVVLLFAMEWFLDRLRAALNVSSHVSICMMTNRLCQSTLRRLDEAQRQEMTSYHRSPASAEINGH